MSILKSNPTTLDMSELLDEWHTSIRNYEVDSSDSLNKSIEHSILSFSDTCHRDIILTYLIVKARYLLLKGNRKESIKVLQEARAKMVDSDEYYLFYYHFIEGMQLKDIREYHNALEQYKKARVYESAVDDSFELADFQYKLATIYWQLDYCHSSLELLKQVYEVYEEYSEIKLADCLLLMGLNNADLGLFNDAEEKYHSALIYANEHNDIDLIGSLYLNLGLLYSQQGMSPEAITYLEKSVKEHPEHKEVIKSLYRLTKELYICDKIEEAKEYLDSGTQLAARTNDTEYIHKFSILTESKVQSDNFETKLQLAADYFSSTQKLDLLVECYEMLGNYHQKKNDLTKATEYFRLTIENFKALNNRRVNI
ncbi:tetratricopeptide repeat protein [Terribacillus saccharophilus]|uniref:tetratricopeptide repeat protein n=1 Tax=Terribacillus saccharophilus TaxID=361277 RepID=UPI002989B3D5|nr:hypothetical protein [Terribacillus saccharophilus]MCM3227502.1 hypothetical protein [Terribacillus saccharophilus]